ncbi:MAG: hypothetical protein KDA84_11100 [Planctomycetaceae bacterium]|nr:hypothetical protein [Planctomycetaceae bacterium]
MVRNLFLMNLFRRALLYWLPASVLVAGCFFAMREGQRASADSAVEKETESKSPADAKEALQQFNELIGEWRGVGMPRRGSRAGAWFETAEWVWDFEAKTPAIKYEVKKSQLLDTARMTWDVKTKKYHLKAKLPDETTREYTGAWDKDGKLVLESAANDEGTTHRITLTPLNEKRTLVLHEQRSGQGLYRRVAEVGYTRSGTSLAVEGAGERECIVTGGKGTIAVSFKGKTYYVCCTGCKQAFDEDPEGTIAAYEQKVADRKAKKGQ